MRWHQESQKHEDAVRKQQHLLTEVENQKRMEDFVANDPEGARIIRLLRAMLFICKEDAPISMFTRLVGFMAHEGVKDVPKQSYGVYITQESLAVKDAAAAFPDFKIIDAVIRALGEIVGRSTPWYERFKHLQMVIHNTNLEHQGLYLIRWLSRGDAIKRLCSILGAAIVVLIEYNHKLAPVVKTLKFHYCLYFLADVLAEMNTLNRFFQRRSVDITLVSQEVDRTVTYIRHRYIEYGATFGGGMSKRLTKFLQRHASGKRSIVVDGMDNDGSPCTHAFELSEEKLPGHKFGGSMSDCEDLCSAAAELELKTFVHIMKNHRADDDFNQGLAAMLKTRDWPKSYPNLMALWQAMAVLPLSTVECERGFSRQNVIKSWLRTSLCDARLSELMTINMLDYDMDYAEIVDIWRKQKMRKQAKTVAYETPLDKGKSAAEVSDEEIAASEGSYEDDDDDDDD
ncbi:hypothetical protein CLOP_g1737 [Closterium sp. NIES-67]|nr:hypothetical protein CLOP_g1737 [Closterium sp. NIES-67]